MEISVGDDESVDMSESAGTPLSKTKSISKNYSVRNSNFRKTRLKVTNLHIDILFSPPMSLSLALHSLHQF